MKRKLLITLLMLGLISVLALGSEKKGVVISEVSWSGTKASWADEWIELHNNSDQKVELEGFRIVWDEVVIPLGKEKKNTLTLNHKSIAPGGYFLMERSDDKTVETIEADLIFKGGLNNSGEDVKLLKEGQVIDSIECKDGWPAGVAGSGQEHRASMVKTEGKWVTSKEKSKEKDAHGNPIFGSPSSGNEES